MNRKITFLILAGCCSALLLCCGGGSGKSRLIRLDSETAVFTVDPVTLETTMRFKDRPSEKITVSEGVFRRRNYTVSPGSTTIRYGRDNLTVTCKPDGDALTLTFRLGCPGSVTWPAFGMTKSDTVLIWPHFEGNYIPLSNTVWTDYLTSRTWDTTEEQYMPFWGVERNNGMLTYIIENPFHNSVAFTDKAKSVDLSFTHTFPDNNDVDKPVTFIVYADRDASPITPAVHFRKHLEEQGKLVSLEEKMKTAPPIERLIGAPHAYIWDGAPVTIADVKPGSWQDLARAVLEQAAAGTSSAGERIFAVLPHDSSAEETFEESAGLSSPYSYLRRSMTYLLSQALRSADFYSETVWPPSTLPAEYRSTAETLTAGGHVDGTELVPFNSHLLHAAFPDCLTDPSTWGNGVSTRMIDALVETGFDRFVLACNGIELIETRPHVAKYAAERGFLMGPYDGYDSVHDPASPQWPTAAFDRELYETCAVRRPDGTPIKGFHGVGYTANPRTVRPYFDERIAENFRKAPHSYYFLDGESFGIYHDDYSPGRITSAREDAEAKVDRVRSVFERYHVPVGSEGGSYLFADTLSVAEGVFFPVITGDPDMEINELSKYFLGRPFPSDGPEQHLKSVPLKERYVTLLSDPRFRLPLYETVFHDCIVSTSHYASSSLKFSNIAETTALTEILYQVPSMYHLNLERFGEIKEIIKAHTEVFEQTHSYSYRYPLTEFAYLTEDRLVQRTVFGGLELTANFRNTEITYRTKTIPARSVLALLPDSAGSFVYTPRQIRAYADAVPVAGGELSPSAAFKNLNNGEWQIRYSAVETLANMPDEASSAVPALIETLNDKEWQVRRAAAYALGAIGKKARKAIPRLIETLEDEEWQLRKAAVTALGSMGPGSRKSLPALKERLEDPELQVRRAARRSIDLITEGSH